MTQRRVAHVLLITQFFAAILVVIGQFTRNPYDPAMAGGIGAMLISAVLLGAYRRGWEYARHVNVVLITLIIALTLPPENVVKQQSIFVLVVPALALALTPPNWIVGSMIVMLAILLLRGNGYTVYTDDLRSIAAIVLGVGSMYMGRVLADTARKTAEQNAERAEEQAHALELQAHDLERRATELAERNEQQQRLIDLVSTLETTAVALADGVLLAPIVGHLDSRRATALTDRLLQNVSEGRARLVILDIAGVASVDAEVASGLIRTAQALRLLGCQVAVTGISPDVAETLTRLQIGLDGIMTARAPQDALALYHNGQKRR